MLLPEKGEEETLPQAALDGAARLNPLFWGPGQLELCPGPPKQGICFLEGSANLVPGRSLPGLFLSASLGLGQGWGGVIDCLKGAVLILEGLCIMEEMSIRKELTQIIRFLIERMGEGVF